MLLSKRSEMFLPMNWPSYFSKAKGCSVWDLDGNKYIDMSIMGIGTNILGYGQPEVDDAATGEQDAADHDRCMVAQPAGAVRKCSKIRGTRKFQKRQLNPQQIGNQIFFPLQLASTYVVCYYPTG